MPKLKTQKERENLLKRDKARKYNERMNENIIQKTIRLEKNRHLKAQNKMHNDLHQFIKTLFSKK